MSKDVYKAVEDLKDFNYKNIYAPSMTKLEKANVKKMFTELFEQYLKDLENKNKKSNIYKDFLDDMNKEYIVNTKNSRKVIDYIAGMTDDYMIEQYNLLKSK
jgi:dGTPase